MLVHGMSHGAWCWEPLGRRLQGSGHRVLALDLPGHGRRAHEWRRASVDAYARAVADAMALNGVSRGIVVGHSMAGVVIPKVAELVPTRVAHLVFLAAVVPLSGASLRDNFAPSIGAIFTGLARASGGLVQYPAVLEHARWMNDLPPGDPRVVDALGQLTAQPLRPWMEPVDLQRFSTLPIPRTYVRCLDDAAVPPAKAAEYAARLGVAPVDLHAAHGLMLSKPDALARVLESL